MAFWLYFRNAISFYAYKTDNWISEIGEIFVSPIYSQKNHAIPVLTITLSYYQLNDKIKQCPMGIIFIEISQKTTLNYSLENVTRQK